VTSSTGRTLSAYRVADGARLWTRRFGGYVYAAPAVADGVVVTGSYDRTVRAFDAVSGRPRWTAAVGGRVSGAPQIVAGVVWAGRPGRIEARNLRSGRLLQAFPRGDYAPISGDAHTLILVGYSRLWGLRPTQRGR
jgi:outer membrane protein assembly factor BamB